MRTKLLFALLFCSIFAHAQREETVLGRRGLGLTGGWGGWTSGITKFGSDYAFMSGGFGGAEFGKTLLLGGAGYHMVSDVKFDQANPLRYELSYGGPMIGVQIGSWRAVHPTISLMGGAGKSRFEGESTDHVFVVQPAAGIEINVFRWFHLGLDGGYRFVADSDFVNASDDQLSSAFGEVKLKFGYSFGRGKRHKKHERNDD
jgi:hypothetical protein